METKTRVVTKQDNKKAVHVQQEYDIGVRKSNKPRSNKAEVQIGI